VNRVWDCFFFNNEVDILEARLRELEDVVDRFVLVEGDRTHTGMPKESVFDQNRDRYRRWGDRIEHVIARLDEHIDTGRGRPARDRDDQQRAALGRFLSEATSPNDLVVVSDLDEIPERDVFPYLLERRGSPLRLCLHHGIYHANWIRRLPWANGTLAFRGDQLGEKMVLQRLGHPQGGWDGYVEDQLADAGVHISFLGGVDVIRRKFTAYSDVEFNDIRFHGAPHLERCIEYGIHYQGREVLRRLGRSELTPLLRRLSEDPLTASSFNFSPSPLSPLQARAYCGYTWARTNVRRIPERVLRTLDDHPGLVVGAGAPAFLALDALLRARRQIKAVDEWAATSGVDPRANTKRVTERWR
jgi:beta-1,4-mannosyl-glycoprotein beta-1,4-N-acetylglucosaminyltransferase